MKRYMHSSGVLIRKTCFDRFSEKIFEFINSNVIYIIEDGNDNLEKLNNVLSLFGFQINDFDDYDYKMSFIVDTMDPIAKGIFDLVLRFSKHQSVNYYETNDGKQLVD